MDVCGRVTGKPSPSRETYLSGANRQGEKKTIFLLRLTTTSTVNHTRLIHTLPYMMSTNAYNTYCINPNDNPYPTTTKHHRKRSGGGIKIGREPGTTSPPDPRVVTLAGDHRHCDAGVFRHIDVRRAHQHSGYAGEQLFPSDQPLQKALGTACGLGVDVSTTGVNLRRHSPHPITNTPWRCTLRQPS